ncbi:MAG: trifunctional histidinol dehydrogenase [Icmadophila ericetorum]|nr:trifunctional histidinol dehydrogenase [Icmadophila ericetorum]
MDFESLGSKPKEGLDFKTASYLGHILAYVRPTTLKQAFQLLEQKFDNCVVYLDVTALEDPEDVIQLLDSGALKVFTSPDQLTSIVQKWQLSDPSRLVVTVSATASNGSNPQFDNIQRDLQKVDGGSGVRFCYSDGSSLKHEDVSSLSLSSQVSQYVRVPSDTTQLGQYCHEAMRRGLIPIIEASRLTANFEESAQLLPIISLISPLIKSDRPDGLYPTVVVNERELCLGLVYSSKESIAKALELGQGVYQSRKRGLWFKGETSGDTQELIGIDWDCDGDALRFIVKQNGDGFCHLKTSTCFGPLNGLTKLEATLQSRKQSAPPGSYTARLFSDSKLLQAKIMEEASELCEAKTKIDIAAEAADLFYFAMTRCIAGGVSLKDVESDLDRKSLKTARRKGDAKPKWAEQFGVEKGSSEPNGLVNAQKKQDIVKKTASQVPNSGEPIRMRRYKLAETSPEDLRDALKRPSQRSSNAIMDIVKPIVEDVRTGGDAAVLAFTHKFEKAIALKSPVIRAPFSKELMQLPPETISAIDISFRNIKRFHVAQKEEKPLQVETMPGVVCSRFSRPIQRVGLYVPGGTAVLPSTAMMLGVPAMVAGCSKIVIASPPRSDGTITPEIVYVAHKVGAECIVLAGGAQAVAAMAYGTESITKVDKILGPGNQFVTAAKMLVSNDTTAGVSIDMPAGPSEVLIVADHTANPAFVASDLLSQAEHGADSQVVLIAVDLNEEHLAAIEDELHAQASALPRVDIVIKAIKHSITLEVSNMEEAMKLSNEYAPEHLILQVENAEKVMGMVENAGSVFIGAWTPESVGDYSAGVNHSLPTYGYAKQYSGVNLGSFTKHITSSNLTKEGLKNIGEAVMQLAKVEELEAHRRAVSIRLDYIKRTGE